MYGNTEGQREKKRGLSNDDLSNDDSNRNSALVDLTKVRQSYYLFYMYRCRPVIPRIDLVDLASALVLAVFLEDLVCTGRFLYVKSDTSKF